MGRSIAGREGQGKMSGIVIREAAEADAAAARAFLARLIEENPDTLSLFDAAPTLEEEIAWLRRVAEQPFAFALGAFEGDAMVGLVDFRPETRRRRTASGSLGLSVDRDRRGRGIGRALMTALIDRAKAERPDLVRIELEVVPWNAPAIALYESLGFRTEARRAKAVTNRGIPEDMLLMARLFDG